MIIPHNLSCSGLLLEPEITQAPIANDCGYDASASAEQVSDSGPSVSSSALVDLKNGDNLNTSVQARIVNRRLTIGNG
jgi:hypothetical protein